MNRYSLPHECETWEVAQALGVLDATQQRVVRSYVHNVMYGGMTLDEWCHSPLPRVSKSTWRQPNGRYWGTEDAPNQAFRNAVETLAATYSTWQVREEEKLIRQQTRKATMILARKLDGAAERLALLVDEGESDQVRLKASVEIMNRFKETADKAGSSAGNNELSDDERAARLAALLDVARARRDGQAAGDGPPAVAAAAGTAEPGVSE